ncbi:hypothetical protein F4780DRAFT_522791 [Xylariomycetidae sp. FL0641]|nr:hypothetical protein F4780DRAFT_522791 [Xylariomycetidae sp. FL0641]
MAARIAIVGGGPCGLTLARLLQRRGIDYVLYERLKANSPNPTGGSLDIHPQTGQRAVREAGLWEEFRKRARWEDAVFRVANKNGKVFVELGGDAVDEAQARPEIDRGALRQMFLDSIPASKIKWDHTLAKATLDENRRPVLHFSDGSTASGFKLVVGTDGCWSKLRSLVTDQKPVYAGMQYVESYVERDNPVYDLVARKVGNGSFTSLGQTRQLIFQRQGNGSYRLYLGVSNVPEAFFRGQPFDITDAGATRAKFLSDGFFGTWSQDWKDVIRHLESFRLWSLYYLPADKLHWETLPGLTLAGDAAHVSVPGGEGVNCAMTDAMELVDRITERGLDNVDTAVEEYEKVMLERGREMIKSGARTQAAMFHEDNPAEFLRWVGLEGAE